MAKLEPNMLTNPVKSLFVDRAKIFSTSGYLELEYMANEKFNENLEEAIKHTDNKIRAYFWILGFNGQLIFNLMLTTMHYFKSKYKDYTFSFLSLAAVKMPVFLALFLVSLLRHRSFSAQLIGCLIGSLLSFIATYTCAKHMPDSMTGLLLVLMFQIIGYLFQFVY